MTLFFIKKDLSNKTKFKDFVSFWQDNIANNKYSPVSNFKNSSIINSKLLPVLGEMKLKDINIVLLTKLFHDISEEYTNYKNIDNHKRLPSTIKRIKGVLSSILQSAVELKLIDYNYCRNIKIYSQNSNNTRKEHFYSIETYLIVLNLLKGEALPYQMIIKLALKTGLRKSELFGLIWSDIDFKNHTIMVNRTRNYISKKGIITKPTKNQSSNRVIYVSNTIIEELEIYKTIYQNNYYIFENINFNTISTWFKNWQIKNHITPILTFHDLRHTHATILLSQNVDIKTISSRLGHSSITTTLNIYTHVLKELDKNAVEKIEQIETNYSRNPSRN